MGKVVDPDLLRQRLQVPLQVIANAERRSARVWKQERPGIIAVWVPRNPRLNPAPLLSPYLTPPFPVRDNCTGRIRSAVWRWSLRHRGSREYYGCIC